MLLEGQVQDQKGGWRGKVGCLWCCDPLTAIVWGGLVGSGFQGVHSGCCFGGFGKAGSEDGAGPVRTWWSLV